MQPADQQQTESPWVQTPQGWVSTDPAHAGWVYTAQGWVQTEQTSQQASQWQQTQQWPAQGQWPEEPPKKSRGWRVAAIVGAIAFVVAAAGGYAAVRVLLGGETTITSPDETLSLVVPGGWREQALIGGESFSFGAVNTIEERYLGVVELSKTQVVPGATLGDVSRQFQTGIFSAIENEQLISTSPTGATVAGLPAVELVFRGDFTAGVLKGNFGWLTTIFDAPDRFVVVTAWTTGERFDGTLPTFREITATFKVAGQTV